MKSSKSDPLHTALNVLHEGAFVYDENMNIRFFNTAAEKITGYAREEVLGKKCVTLFDKNLCLNNCALCMTAKTGDIGQMAEFESPFMRRDGSLRMGQFKAGLLRKDSANRSLEVLVCLTDTTELAHLKRQLRHSHSFQGIVGKSQPMLELFDTIQTIAVYDSTVFVHGESGTGKEMVAQAIHDLSPRTGAKLIKVNCSALPANLLESEMFGHIRGAFTGAERDRIGRFEEADGGTIFLDEIAELSPSLQVKLLRVLQEKEIQRVGENKVRRADIRIIAATNRDIQKEVREGRFREDLYYRLHVIPIPLPPLRQRKEDIPHLAQHFIGLWKGLPRKQVAAVGDLALRLMMDHDWPGNVRELENAIEHACIKCTEPVIRPEDLPLSLQRAVSGGKKRPRRRVTADTLRDALRQTGQNQTEAARLLGIHRITLWRKMRQLLT
jgi:PAS domain S-box-containing protein